MSEYQHRFANLPESQRALLLQLLEQKQGLIADGQRIPRRPGGDGPAPASFSQQRLWFLDQFAPGSPVYNMPFTICLDGPLNVPVLGRTFNEIIQRHEALRTTFATGADGSPVQVITPALTLALDLTDLSDLAADEQMREVKRRADEEALRPFDLAKGMLMRCGLLRLQPDLHLLLLTMHHIISDGWSFGILLKELGALYEAFAEGRPSPLPALPVQYADFAVWQRERLQGAVLEEHLAYWKEQLKGAPTVLELPSDRPRPPVQSFRGATLVRSLDDPLLLTQGSSLVEELRELGRREGATLFMVLVAAYQALLFRYTGQEEIIVGTVSANRTRTELEPLIGFFVNTLPLRTDLSGNPTFRELLKRVREVTLGAFAHQDLPFERLVEIARAQRDASRPPLIQATCSLQNTPAQAMGFGGLAVSLLELDLASGTAKFDLSVDFREEPHGLVAEIGYNTDLFDGKSIDRLAGHLRCLLEGAVADPDRRLSELPILTPAERHQLLTAWNETRREYRQAPLYQLFEEQAARAPEALAVTFGEERLTYGELNRQANRLAHHLRSLGVGPEVPVGIAVDRSPAMIAGILAILKAGGAYVPLDPSYPPDRLAFMLEDCGAPVLLTQQSVRERLPETGAAVVCLDDEAVAAALAAGSEANPAEGAGLENLAYVIYTSGSTGRPKGVLIEHRAVSNFIAAVTEQFALTPEDRVLQFASLSFDVSVFEIFSALLTGASLHLGSREQLLSPEGLTALMQERRVTVADLPPAMLALLDSEAFPALRILFVGGEAFPGELVNRWASPGRRFFNGYGPTEATVAMTAMECRRPCHSSPPIGRPMANHQVYLLDRELNPVPVGVPGELHVGGAGLARGYLNRPELTEEKFIPNPFEPESRLYKTGDLARYLPDGQIEFLGRVDRQVKLRGFRIEPGEIEAVLNRHPLVKQAVVTVRDDLPGGRGLAAYLVAEPGAALPPVGELRALVGKELPAHMIPSAFVWLESLPLMPSGKVDHRALPAPGLDRPDLGDSFVAPRSPVEELVAGAMAKLLGIERVGAHDSFFDLGGNSLQATQLLSRLRDAFQVELPLHLLFQTPTVSGLAEHLERLSQESRGAQAPPILPVPRDQAFPLSFAQARLWFIDQLLPDSPLYNIPVFLRLTGRLCLEALEQALGELVRRHEVLRTTFATIDGRPVQQIHPAMALPFPLTDLTHLPPEEREEEAMRQATAEALRPFDLAKGPMIRASLLRLEAEEHLLLLSMHHIVSDGWSYGLLMRELAALYGAFAGGRPSPLPDLPVQYADFAHWQRQWLQGEELEAQLAWWQEQLAGARFVLEMPTDRPRPPVQTNRGATERLVLPPALADSLRALSRHEEATLFMTLLAAFQTLLFRYAGQEDLCVGSPIANRNRTETEGLIGFFVNTLVLRGDLSGNPTFRELLRRVKAVTLGAYAHQDLPFEQLVERLEPVRDLSHTPLFQAAFVLQNASGALPDWPGLRLSPLAVETGTATFDLTLAMEERAGGLEAALEYNADLYDTATVRRMLAHFQQLLEAVAADPDGRVESLPLLTEAERTQLLTGWNQTGEAWPQDRCIHRLVAEQAARTPDAVALRMGDRQWTYGELNRRANRLAHRLQALGIGPERVVGLFVERCPEMVMGLLAVLKAGGAYLPLDPAYPQERLAFMLADAQAHVLLTQRSLLAELPRHEGITLCLDEADEPCAGESEANPEEGAGPGNLAYMIYTSGSTGTPKGVLVEHGSLLNLVCWYQRAFGPTAADRATQVAGPAFDATVMEIWPLLAVGASIHIVDDETRAAPELVRDWLIRERITLCFLPTPLAEGILALEWPDRAAALRLLLTGGDRLHAGPPPGLPFRLANLYGPTENTVVATCGFVPPGSGGAAPDIGRPIANVQLYILDRHLQPVPVGVPGELYLGGGGLSRGYLNRPVLTEERFIANPFSQEPGARLYRTGDLVRYLPDGRVEFLGRTDHQVKIRGFRIETGEIETVLSRHPGVQEAAVIACQAPAGDRRLVAYVVPAPGAAPPPGALRDHLQEQLPDYMIPTAMMLVEALPLTPNGKVDRRALPAPEWSRMESETAFVLPRTPAEERLAAIWAEVLGLETVGVHDSFFALGGHSLLATRLIARVADAFGVKLPLRALFTAPTVAGMAELVEQARGGSPGSAERSPLVLIREGSGLPLFCVHPVGGGVFCYADLARSLALDQPVYGLEAPGLEGERTPLDRVEALAALYIEAIRSVWPEGPYRLAGWSMGGLVAYEMARLLRQEGQEVSWLALIDTVCPTGQSVPSEEAIRAEFARDLAGLAGRELPGPAENSPPENGPEQFGHRFEIFRANLLAALRYQAQPYGGPLLLLRARDSMGHGWPDDLGWGGLAAGGLELLPVPGTHYTMLQPPHVAALAGQIRTRLA